MNLPAKSTPHAGRLRLLALCAVLAQGACGQSGDPGDSSDAPQQTIASTEVDDEASVIVARIHGRSITAAESDAPLQLALHDLEMQKYRLRRQALEAELLRALAPAPPSERNAEILLTPPVPPRLSVQADDTRTRPAGAAPVTVLAFCNFESPHCARLQRTLAQVLPLFPGVVRYAERDLPLDFHRHAGKAAEAALCAAAQGNYWRYHDFLYADKGAPDRAALDRAARSADLEMNRFAECLDGGHYAGQVAADSTLANSLGFSVVPTVLVNGLYASPDVQPADLVWLIESELALLDIDSPRLAPATVASTAPVRLQGLLGSPHAGHGLALLAPSIAPDSVRAYREGDAIATGATLRRIAPDAVELLLEGRTERLGLGDSPQASTQPVSRNADDAVVATPHRAVPVTLDRDQVLVLLSDRIALTAALQTVPMTAGGYHQLRVQAVAPGSLYELLGFAPGDVILGVNEQPVHEASNPLWDALEKESEVRVRVMRRGGLAKHFTYRFDT